MAQQPVADTYTQAASAFQRGNLDAAEQILRSAIQDQADRPDLLGLLAIVLDTKKQYEQAEPLYRRALNLAPRSASLWNNLGNHYVACGKASAARTAFLRVIAIDPQHANANLQLAQMSLSRKHGSQALQYLDHLTSRERTTPAVLLLRARALHLAGQKDGANAIAEQFERSTGADARLDFSLGTMLAEWGEYSRAENAFSRALEKDPANFDILHNLGLAALRAHDFDRAQRAFEIATQQRPEDVDSLVKLAQVHAAAGRDETALVLLAQARRLAPERSDVLLLLARKYAGLGFFSGAAEAYEAYLKLQPQDGIARRERGFAYCRFGRARPALPDLTWYVAQYPRDPIGHFELGLCEALGDSSTALGEINEALRLRPGFVPARYARGSLLQTEGKWQAALTDLKFVVAREPNNALALLRLGRIYLKLERPAEALAVLEQARDLAPDHAGVLTQLYRALRAVGRNEEAAALVARLKTAEPDRAPLKAHAQIFEYLDLSPREQQERFRRNLIDAIATRPADAELKVQLGTLLLEDGKTEPALAAFQAALNLSPAARVLADAATALMDHGQYTLAREFLTRVVAADPSVDNRLDLAVATFHSAGPAASLNEIEKIPAADRNGDAYLLSAELLDSLGRFEDAVAALNTGFRLAPKRAELYGWASLFLLKHNRDQQALELLEHATQAVPNDPDLLLTKAVVLELSRKTGDADRVLSSIQLHWPEWGRSYLIRGIIQSIHREPKDAFESIRTAIALGERTPTAFYYLAEATRMARPDDRQAAQQAIDEALRLDPGDAWFHALAGKIALDSSQTDQAIAHLKDAIRLNPKLAEAHYSLGVIYRKLGDPHEAAAEFEIVRRLREQNPEGDEGPTSIRQLLFPVQSPG